VARVQAPIRRVVRELPASRIRQVSLAARGVDDVIALWFGEGDEVTPAFIRDAAAAALHRGETFYGPNLGAPELRAAIQRYLQRIYAAEVGLERIAVSASGMNALMINAQCLAGHGDSAVVIGPVWPNIENAIAAIGATVRRVDLAPTDDGGWRLDLDRVIDACDATTRLVFVNSPGNPTGWVASDAELRALLDLARARGLWLVADEVYGRLTFDAPHAPSLVTLADADDPVVIVNSLSKAWSMTGWRLGWIVAPRELLAVLEKMTEFNV
jgi:aspartate aminotransferase